MKILELARAFIVIDNIQAVSLNDADDRFTILIRFSDQSTGLELVNETREIAWEVYQKILNLMKDGD